jgi:circadian clock protein KaiC
VIIGYHVDGSAVRRAIHVLKSRGSAHDQQIYEFTLSSSGLTIGDPIELDLGLPRRYQEPDGAADSSGRR